MLQFLKNSSIKKTFFYIVFSFIVITLLTSCDPTKVYEENIGISELTWNKSNIIPFTFNCNDTVNLHNVYINVRNAGDYGYSNLYLFVTTTYPNGELSKDTIECTLADDKGEWLGDGSGEIFDNQILFKSNVRFKQAGKYIFSYEQAMRVDKLPQIMDVGLRIEKAK